MNIHTPCAYEGCVRTAHEGFVLYRVNPTGERGIFMCEEHAREVNDWRNREPE